MFERQHRNLNVSMFTRINLTQNLVPCLIGLLLTGSSLFILFYTHSVSGYSSGLRAPPVDFGLFSKDECTHGARIFVQRDKGFIPTYKDVALVVDRSADPKCDNKFYLSRHTFHRLSEIPNAPAKLLDLARKDELEANFFVADYSQYYLSPELSRRTLLDLPPANGSAQRPAVGTFFYTYVFYFRDAVTQLTFTTFILKGAGEYKDATLLDDQAFEVASRDYPVRDELDRLVFSDLYLIEIKDTLTIIFSLLLGVGLTLLTDQLSALLALRLQK